MQVVIREYSGKGAKELFGMLEKNKAEVESVLRSVKGLVGNTLAVAVMAGFR